MRATKKRVRGIKEKLWTTKRDAKKRGIAWQIKDADALELFTLPCYWCAREPAPFNGIDRKNNERYYRKSNALPCCWDCNRMKRTLTEKQWRAFCEQVFMEFYKNDVPFDVEEDCLERREEDWEPSLEDLSTFSD
jgi:hypothetical protein